MGKITFTIRRQVTVRQEVHYERRIQYPVYQTIYTQAPTPISTAPVQRALNDYTNELKNTQRKLEAATRTRSIPTGVYGKPVEDVFYALDERRKEEEQEAQAIYDVFISHASEDKADFVNPLVEKLQEAGISVWYDSLEMQWGKSLREQIDNGIKRSKFAIVILSKNFFKKQWPKRELDGILAKETVTGNSPLPIWYNITYEDVYEFSPTLSGVKAITSSTHSIDDICKAFQLTLAKTQV